MVVLLVLAPLTAAPLALPQASQSAEYQLKAAFLFSFAKFIDWPDESFSGAQAPFTICVLGEDPFGHVLDDSLAGKTIGNRSIEVTRFLHTTSLGPARHCQIAFISASEKQHFREIASTFNGSNVLLVGDSPGFATSGGMIELMIEDKHVRFAINPEAADRASLKVSSKLLALAQIVHEEPKPNGD